LAAWKVELQDLLEYALVDTSLPEKRSSVISSNFSNLIFQEIVWLTYPLFCIPQVLFGCHAVTDAAK
jgi:hypothetical protein